jgi:hypothetical protein
MKRSRQHASADRRRTLRQHGTISRWLTDGAALSAPALFAGRRGVLRRRGLVGEHGPQRHSKQAGERGGMAQNHHD